MNAISAYSDNKHIRKNTVSRETILNISVFQIRIQHLSGKSVSIEAQYQLNFTNVKLI